MAIVTVVFTKSIDVPDSLLSLINQDADDYVINLINNADMPDILEGAEVSVTLEDGESDAVSAPVRQERSARAAQSPASASRAPQPTPARPVRQSAPVESHESEDSAEPVRRGRPPRLVSEDGSEWEASDGGPVTQWGKRSPAELKTEGIACRKVGAAAWPKWFVRQQAELEMDDDETEDETPAPRRQTAQVNLSKAPGNRPVASAASAPAPAMRRRAQ